MKKTRAHLHIRGSVQGVSFRYYTLQEAQSVQVIGWVRNLWDGRVEALIEGEQTAVDHMVEWCRKGPPMADVEDVAIIWEEPTGEFSNFRVRVTASGVE
ncbi:MAG: acylphosphatase [Anaerolineales bacterium]|nr:MAG: acylphosphatase [Anaerolineales bacterium]